MEDVFLLMKNLVILHSVWNMYQKIEKTFR